MSDAELQKLRRKDDEASQAKFQRVCERTGHMWQWNATTVYPYPLRPISDIARNRHEHCVNCGKDRNRYGPWSFNRDWEK